MLQINIKEQNLNSLFSLPFLNQILFLSCLERKLSIEKSAYTQHGRDYLDKDDRLGLCAFLFAMLSLLLILSHGFFYFFEYMRC
uniref:Uncharacterized protein n=1 Tax=Rhizophora mucronata TaxID=61149 RepID=A0A2P2M241_RHIMU